jgi:2-methylaconitate cis-trans-isomerase PrpF
LVVRHPAKPDRISIEHPSGKLEAQVDLEPGLNGAPPTIHRVGIVRTARPLFSGQVLIPGAVWKKTKSDC